MNDTESNKTINVDIPLFYLFNIALNKGPQHVWASKILWDHGYEEELERRRQLKMDGLMGRIKSSDGDKGVDTIGNALNSMADSLDQ